MAKSIRSKIKRKHRTEFRRTIGEEAAQKQMSIVQQKLQECISTGPDTAVSTMQRLSKKLFGEDSVSDHESMDAAAGEVAVDTDVAMVGDDDGKREDKIAHKKASSLVKKSYRRKRPIDAIPGTDAARLARKMVNKAKRRGKMSRGQFVSKPSSAPRKRKGKNFCAF
mmetsp:Transcript_9435/g.14026  ORF Transcript_9435/g.14026 Transcript_9435/m.14026 type:complete len:167 (+) Transcript_9435:76-576(+)|eukprot:CAMPEP_0196815748 /NCGR_PEP_ID=MMETSP1362-20130617/51663_1 /TAXON_ID=163516 /ORGANISM="Leptocylindrus danicus, Strain CCMP1856" /LENGTH=166 /DNA_ID=CAMNT_0042192823 /DNA_START=37 /DNA_END=537 /DNA_ORIENTATION=-